MRIWWNANYENLNARAFQRMGICGIYIAGTKIAIIRNDGFSEIATLGNWNCENFNARLEIMGIQEMGDWGNSNCGNLNCKNLKWKELRNGTLGELTLQWFWIAKIRNDGNSEHGTQGEFKLRETYNREFKRRWWEFWKEQFGDPNYGIWSARIRIAEIRLQKISEVLVNLSLDLEVTAFADYPSLSSPGFRNRGILKCAWIQCAMWTFEIQRNGILRCLEMELLAIRSSSIACCPRHAMTLPMDMTFKHVVAPQNDWIFDNIYAYVQRNVEIAYSLYRPILKVNWNIIKTHDKQEANRLRST